ncbi:MAG: PAS domain S-box protein [Verrucomicrobiae bacterium]|nr:PAS domain S-box protein [Verrucomicrobiae bacterium]
MQRIFAQLGGMAYRTRLDDEFTWVWVGGGCEELTGFTAGELTGTPGVGFLQRIHPSDRATVKMQIALAALEQHPYRLAYRLVRRDGETRWVWDQGTITTDGHREGFLADITARKNAEEALRQRTNDLQLQQVLATAVHESVSAEAAFHAVLSLIGNYYDWPVGHVYFVAKDNPIELQPSDIWHLGDSQRYRVLREATQTVRLTAGEELVGQVLQHRQPLALLDLRDVAEFPRAPFFAETGLRGSVAAPVMLGDEVVAVLEFFWDRAPEPNRHQLDLLRFAAAQLARIVERQRAEEQLRHRERTFRTLIENASDVFALLDESGVIRYISPSVERVLGYHPSELEGRSAFERIHPDDVNAVLAEFAQRIEQPGATGRIEYRYRHKNGQWRILESIGTNLAQDSSVRGVAVTTHDITDRKNAERLLQRRLDFERLVSTLSAHFINLPAEVTDDAVSWALEEIGRFLGADRAYLFQFSPGRRHWSNTHEWCAPGVESAAAALQHVPVEAFPWLMQRWRNGELVHLPQRDALPAEAVAERAEFEREGIQSIACVPLFWQKDLVGVVGVDAVRQPRTWAEDELTLLRVAGEMLVNLLVRARAERDLLQAHRALRASEERYRTLFATMQEGFALIEVIFNADGVATDFRYVEVNPAFERLTGLKPHQVTGRLASEVLPNLEHTCLDVLGHVARTGQPARQEKYHPDFKRWYELFAFSPRRGQVAVVFNDITTRKAAEEKLRLQGQALAAAGNGILITDSAGTILWVNPALCRLTGYSADELVGQRTQLFKSGMHDQAFYQQLWDTVLAGRTWRGELINRRKDGSLYTAELVITPVCDTTGRVTHMVAVHQDITDRKEAEQKLRETNRQLETALQQLRQTQQQIVQQERLRALGTMASGIAHDFNNALAAILGFSELLLNQPQTLADPSKAQRFLQLIHTSARDAATVVHRLREFYRHRDAREVMQPVAINEVVQEAISMTEPRWRSQALAQGRTIEIVTELQPHLPPIPGNAAELREVLTNLIFNAVDALPEGGAIRIRTRRDAEQLVLEVEDNGTGMTEEVQRRCFEPFFSTKGERGTGLGLAMVYGIITRHNGTIEVRSQLGQGTTFIIRLPLQSSGPVKSAEAETATTPSAPRALSVLLIEDEPPVRAVLQELLLAEGHRVTTAPDGHSGLSAFEPGRFDIVLVDRAMPGLNGDQVAAAIKHRAPRLPVVLITGFGSMMQAAGEKPSHVDLVLSKPITRDTLRDALRQLVR